MHLLAVLHLLLLLSVALSVAQSGPPDQPGAGKSSKICEEKGGKCMSIRACEGKVIINAKCKKSQICCASKTGCPEENGFFYQYSSGQCFKLFDDKGYTYEEAISHCESKGLVLARPYDAIGLRSYIVQRYGNVWWAWCAAQGNGTEFIWRDDGAPIIASSPLWYPSYPDRTTNDFCLRLLVNAIDWSRVPDSTYADNLCEVDTLGGFPLLALCELVMT